VQEITYAALRAHYQATRASSRHRQLSFRPFCRFLEERGIIQVAGINRNRIAALPVALGAPMLRYINPCVRPRCSKSYLASTEGTLAEFGRFLVPSGVPSVAEVAPEIVEAYAATVSERGLAANTVNRQLSVLEMFCRQLIEWGLLKRQAVLPRLYFKEDDALPRSLSLQTCTLVVAALRARPRPAAHVAAVAAIVSLECGLRVGELVNLTRRNIADGTKTIRIDLGKGRKDRVVPISDRAAQELRNWIESHPAEKGCDAVFQHKDRGRLSNCWKATARFYTCCPRSAVLGDRASFVW
jgi:site-specific recombinase XerD